MLWYLDLLFASSTNTMLKCNYNLLNIEYAILTQYHEIISFLEKETSSMIRYDDDFISLFVVLLMVK